ncbi:uncharacterized protein LOC128990735 isoform X2 [Macrosteles quadrilineatus]|uniref:uncharacterized protein LOC128990735 isoform X2 n=1 Tax=Macrosteles quadrilineatus TaxID=74068 RepID=UPI0023E11817|nr:uncharacterized protein LOC128990735 isoform X2 [Macrosteles quadrilineatus]
MTFYSRNCFPLESNRPHIRSVIKIDKMLPEAQLVFATLSVFVLLTIIMALVGCVCGCRKTVPKPNQAASSATRSLPDLPVESQRLQGSRSVDGLYETADAGNGDTSSDLYATVEDNKNGARGASQKPQLPRDSTIESSYDSPSQTDNSLSPYARVRREHPYDQVKQTDEHPYAQVRANGKAGPSHHVQDLTLHQSPSSSSVEHTDSPIAPPRTRKSISLSQSSLSSNLGVEVNIPAATAIAGGIPANQELPYMTPPLPLPASPPSHQPVSQTQHFSGDSQDSSKGYTSISVREPLSNILSQVPRRQELIDSHYATVSDDSDEMYAAIEEPNQAVYTSGSETYAQIRPMGITVAATVNPVPVRTESLQPQQPSTTSLATVKNHTRQESSSSACSSIANPSSPKPEKRQANSPLPRPPDPGTSVDEMYAKVMKKRRSSHSISSVDHDTGPASLPGYETVRRSHSPHGGNTAFGYETVANHCVSEGDVFCSGYETVAGEHDSLVPGYERVAGGREEHTSDVEPNYEELKPQNTMYAMVNKKRKTSKLSNCEPDYASLSRKDSGYERVEGFDPNYESLCRDSDPNYESVEKPEPPYEKVQASTSNTPVFKDNGIHEDVYSQVVKNRTVR